MSVISKKNFINLEIMRVFPRAGERSVMSVDPSLRVN